MTFPWKEFLDFGKNWKPKPRRDKLYFQSSIIGQKRAMFTWKEPKSRAIHLTYPAEAGSLSPVWNIFRNRRRLFPPKIRFGFIFFGPGAPMGRLCQFGMVSVWQRTKVHFETDHQSFLKEQGRTASENPLTSSNSNQINTSSLWIEAHFVGEMAA